MKKLITLILMSSTAAFASEVTVLNTTLNRAAIQNRVETSFQVNQTTGEGLVKVRVTKQYSPRPTSPSMTVEIYNAAIPVEGLSLHGDRLVFAAATGDVECGTLGESRVFKKPTIYLSGNCELVSKIQKKKLSVVLKTK